MPIPIIIVGGDREQRLALVKLDPHPDRLVITTDKAVSITAVRGMAKFLNRKPYQEKIKTAIITDADQLTLPAQQALLKTLEEPPANSQIFLLAPSANLLLPTIISRCRVQNLPSTELTAAQLKQHHSIYDQLVQAVDSQKLSLISPYEASQTTAVEFVNGQLLFLRRQLKLKPRAARTDLIRALLIALKALKVNVNPKLTLDVLALNY